MIKIQELNKIASACHLLEPPAPEVIISLLEEIKRLHSKLNYIHENSTETSIVEFAKENIYNET